MKEVTKTLEELQAELEEWKAMHPINHISAMGRTAKIESLTEKIKKITETEYLSKKGNEVSGR